MSAVSVRPVNEGDIHDVAAIYGFESVIANTGQIPHRDTKFWHDFYKSREPNGVELVGIVDGKAVGHLGMILNHTPRRKRVGTFGICVHPDF